MLVLQEDAAEALSKFYYPPVCAATISYPISAVRADRLDNGKLLGFGQLHPRSQGVQTLGTVLDSKKSCLVNSVYQRQSSFDPLNSMGLFLESWPPLVVLHINQC